MNLRAVQKKLAARENRILLDAVCTEPIKCDTEDMIDPKSAGRNVYAFSISKELMLCPVQIRFRLSARVRGIF